MTRNCRKRMPASNRQPAGPWPLAWATLPSDRELRALAAGIMTANEMAREEARRRWLAETFNAGKGTER